MLLRREGEEQTAISHLKMVESNVKVWKQLRNKRILRHGRSYSTPDRLLHQEAGRATKTGQRQHP